VRAYADTSWWLALRNSSDALHRRASAIFDLQPLPEVIWTPWQRVEVFNAIRQAERHGLLEEGSGKAQIHRIEREVRLGYWPHVEFNWTEAIRTANELSDRHSRKILIRGMDLFHVAAALETASDWFLTFDTDQAVLAKAAGLKLML
jgi:predicted nucleic acid-binding protein